MKKDKKTTKKVISSDALKDLLAPITELDLVLIKYQEIISEDYLYDEYFWDNEDEYANVSLPSDSVMVKKIITKMMPKLEQLIKSHVENMSVFFQEFEKEQEKMKEEREIAELENKEVSIKKEKLAKTLTQTQKKLFKEAYNIAI